MSWIDRVKAKLFSTPTPTPTRGEQRDVWKDYILANRSVYNPTSAAGVVVTEASSLTATAVYACVRVLAETVSSLPLITYKRLPGGGKERDTTSPIYRILHDEPNSEMTSLEFREYMMAALLLWGNAYAEIAYDRAGRVRELWPLAPKHVTIRRREDGRLEYVYQVPGGGMDVLQARQMMHIRGLSIDGVMGLSPIAQARRAIGLALATEEFGSRFFSNGARPGGVLQHPGTLSDAAMKHLKESWEEDHRGLERSSRVAVLEEGMKYEMIGVPPEDAQFLETRKFQTSEIARIYRVPLHMIGDLDRATFSNIEQQSIDFVMHTVRPWLVRWEQQIDKKLFTPDEKEAGYFSEFLVDGLLRGDIQSRYAAYAVGRQNGWLSANDVRGLENLNPIEGGDVYLVPLNMVPAGDGSGSGRAAVEVIEERAGANPKRGAMERSKIMRAYQPVMLETTRQIVRRACSDLKGPGKKALGKRSDGWAAWQEKFWAEFERWAAGKMRPAAGSLAELIADQVERQEGQRLSGARVDGFSEAYAAEAGKRIANRLRSALDKAIEDEDPEDALEPELERWEEEYPAGMAQVESIRLGNGLAKIALLAAGRTVLTWVTMGNASCPYCQEMNGKAVRGDDYFVQDGDAVAGLEPGQAIGHPPLHDGCECGIG